MEEDLKAYLADAEQIAELLFVEHFQLSDIGLTSKIAFDWSKAGIYLRERKSKYRRKYNGLEYVWLRLVKDLREFGLPIDAIINLRDYLLTELDFQDYFKSIFEKDELEGESLKFFLSELKKAVETPQDFVAEVHESNIKLNNTLLSVLVFSTIFTKSNVHLAITKNGDCHVFEESPMLDLFTSSMILNQPYISVPLNHIIAEFMGREDLYELSMTDNLTQLNPQEKKVVDLIRKGGINALNVKFLDGEVNLIETEETFNPKDVKGKIVDLIKRGAYQEIVYKTEKGKVVSVKRKTKHK